MSIFVGFSTIVSGINQFHDIELVNIDLLNHFHTREGERVMRPTFGCKIWNWLFEPLTDTLKNEIIGEATRICSSDPRVQLVDTIVSQLDGGLRIEMTLNYIPMNVVNTFTVDFENREIEAWK